MKDIKANWAKEIIDSELKFWDDWFRTKGLDWPEDYLFRIDPETELQEYLRPYLQGEESKEQGEIGMKMILDVGSGPLTILGKRLDGVKLNIVCADPLANEYKSLLQKYEVLKQVQDDYHCFSCAMENIAQLFVETQFDLVHAQNCVDHSYDPVRAVCEMICVCKPGGTVFLKHERNEAENEAYSGLHQWNFDCVDGKFVISGADERTVMDDYLASVFDGLEIETRLEEGYVITRITRINANCTD